MAFFSGLRNRFLSQLDPRLLAIVQASAGDEHDVTGEMAQRFRALQDEHQRLRSWDSRRRFPADASPMLDLGGASARERAQPEDGAGLGGAPGILLAAGQEGFDRHQEQAIARQRAQETGRDERDILREMRMLPSRGGQVASEGNIDAAATGGIRSLPPTELAADNREVANEKMRRGGGVNGWGYMPTNADRDLLARIIYAESFTTPEDDVAIGWATVNRIGQPGFADTLEGVLRQPEQFQIVSEGNRGRPDNPRFTESAHPERLPSPRRVRFARARKVADGILNGAIEDPTGQATFFHASDDAADPRGNSPWFTNALANKRIVPSIYTSQARGRTRNYFYNLNKPPGRR